MKTREAVVRRIVQLCKERITTPYGIANQSGVWQATLKEHFKWMQ